MAPEVRSRRTRVGVAAFTSVLAVAVIMGMALSQPASGDTRPPHSARPIAASENARLSAPGSVIDVSAAARIVAVRHWVAAVEANQRAEAAAAFAAKLAAARRAEQQRQWQATHRATTHTQRHTSSQRATTSSSHSTGSVGACVKAHESGNYSESSHPGEGSGAYQYTPGTWRSWSAKAGYGGYAYAYQAPPSVQDAVFNYTIANGGAHNWDPKFGNDPCTTGLP